MKNRSPLSGSTVRPAGHVRSDASVLTIAPVLGSSSTTTPVLKLPPVPERTPYRRPSLPTTSQPSVGPRVESLLAFETTPPVGSSLNRSPFRRFGAYKLPPR